MSWRVQREDDDGDVGDTEEDKCAVVEEGIEDEGTEGDDVGTRSPSLSDDDEVDDTASSRPALANERCREHPLNPKASELRLSAPRRRRRRGISMLRKNRCETGNYREDP